ncbi:hypothetical protein GCM10027572_23740 [Flexivirga lutea]
MPTAFELVNVASDTEPPVWTPAAPPPETSTLGLPATHVVVTVTAAPPAADRKVAGPAAAALAEAAPANSTPYGSE